MESRDRTATHLEVAVNLGFGVRIPNGITTIVHPFLPDDTTHQYHSAVQSSILSFFQSSPILCSKTTLLIMTSNALVNRWKVILDPSITDTAFTSHLEAVCYAQQTGRLDQLIDPSPPQAEARPAQAESHPSISEVFSPDLTIVRYVFHIGDLRAYSGSFSPDVVAAILPLSIVRDVQPVHRIFPRAMVCHLPGLLIPCRASAYCLFHRQLKITPTAGASAPSPTAPDPATIMCTRPTQRMR